MKSYIKNIEKYINSIDTEVSVLLFDLSIEELELLALENINLNYKLSKVLAQQEIKRRQEILEEELDNILLRDTEKRLYINGIDILFNPSYNFDVFRYFSKISRHVRMIIAWPGKYFENQLIYSEINLKDYRKVDCKINSINIINKGRI